MKTSSIVPCAIAAFVLGLSAAASPPQALAAVERIHPATMCLRIAGANITRASGGTIENNSPTTDLLVQCDIVNEADLNVAGPGIQPRIIEGLISATVRHPALQIGCQLTTAVRSFQTSELFIWLTSKPTVGPPNNTLKFLFFEAPDPGGLGGKRSNNYYLCFIPRAVNGVASQLHFYSVVEE